MKHVHHVLSFSFVMDDMDDMDEIFLRVLLFLFRNNIDIGE